MILPEQTSDWRTGSKPCGSLEREHCRGAQAKAGTCRTILWFVSDKIKYTVPTSGAKEWL